MPVRSQALTWRVEVHERARLPGDEDLLLPDLRTLPPSDLRLIMNAQGTRKLIRFSNSVWNSGPGVLEVAGDLDRQNASVAITQKIATTGEQVEARPVGEFVFHVPHNHWHLDGFSIYEVWTVKHGGVLGERLVASDKVSYCMRDDATVDALLLSSGVTLDMPRWAQFTGCGWARQGISAGWADIYRSNLPGQIIDISAIPDGLYALKSTVNPDGILYEANTSNNSGVRYFELQGNRLMALGRFLPPIHHAME